MSAADTRRERLEQLQRDHAELVASLPAHSVPASMLMRIEELEDEIATLQASIATNPPSVQN